MSNPGKEFHCIVLMGRPQSFGYKDAVIDEKARRSYEERIRELKDEIAEDTSYLQLMPGILRQLWDLATKENQGRPPEDVKLYLGREHPAYQPINNTTRLRRGEMQCLYIRVADVVDFLRHIAPALEKNLAASSVSDFTGKLQITMFRSGLEIDLKCGRIDRIDRCIALLVDNKEAICDAVNSDFGCRSKYVTLMTDVMNSVGSLKFVRKNLKKWILMVPLI